MGRANPVTIAGRSFKTQGEAVSYFNDQKEERLSTGLIESGELYVMLEDLYERYCDNSPGYELNGRLITGFVVAFEKRKNGEIWAKYPCYKVRFSNDETRPFSIKKAVRSIVKSG